MEIKAGMYVRFFNGNIGKIASYEYREEYVNGHCIRLEGEQSGCFCEEKDFRVSDNIAELLEVGDFLDSHCIVKIEDRTMFTNDGWFINFDDVEDLVYTVVTKEQFESMGYKVGD